MPFKDMKTRRAQFPGKAHGSTIGELLQDPPDSGLPGRSKDVAFVSSAESKVQASRSRSDILQGCSERSTPSIPSHTRRRQEGCDVYSESFGLQTGRKNMCQTNEISLTKGRGTVKPNYAGSSNPITQPDSVFESLKQRYKAKVGDNHGNIISEPPEEDKARRQRNNAASKEILKKHGNGDIITGENQNTGISGKARSHQRSTMHWQHSTADLLQWKTENGSNYSRSTRKDTEESTARLAK